MQSAAEMIGFKSMRERAIEERELREKMQVGLIRFKNPFLHATMNAIFNDDTILLGAEPGVGKTQMSTEIAEDAARAGKNVFVFALEASRAEWERRKKFGIISDLFKADGGDVDLLDYQDWMSNDMPELKKYEEQAIEAMSTDVYSRIHTFYKEDIFGLKDFVAKFAVISEKADLVIVDHIHYFDLFGKDHNAELSEIMHKIRHLTQTLGVPVILVAHLRKIMQGQERKILPDIADFHGSSELSKVCTRGIMLAPGEWSDEHKGFLTYIKTVKNRFGGSRTRIAGRILYDPRRDKYDPDFVEFGMESYDKTEFLPLQEIPLWLKKKLEK